MKSSRSSVPLIVLFCHQHLVAFVSWPPPAAHSDEQFELSFKGESGCSHLAQRGTQPTLGCTRVRSCPLHRPTHRAPHTRLLPHHCHRRYHRRCHLHRVHDCHARICFMRHNKKCAHASRRQQHSKPHITNNNCVKMQQGKKPHFRCSLSLLLFSTAIGRVHRKKYSQRLLLKVLFARRTVPIIAAAILVGLARKCNIHAGMLRGSSDAGQFGSTLRKERVVVYRTCVGAHYGEENFETAMCQRQRQRERAVVAEYMCLQEPPIGQEQEVEVMLRPSAGNLTEIS